MTPHEERTEQHREHVEAERPHLDLKESRTPVSRTAEELRLEYKRALQELNGPRTPPRKRSTSRKSP